MRNVTRLPKPHSLQNNSSRWKRELLAKIEESGQEKTKVPDIFYDKYKQNDVRGALEKMYNGLCCYCESEVGVVEFGHIEHRKPKKPFPESAFDWHNLHLSCTRCNTTKGKKYSMKYPILDAVKDQISKHMKYKIKPRGLYWDPLTKRGKTTESHVGLNRDKLPEHRRAAFLEAMDLITQIKENQNAPAVNVVQLELQEVCKEKYGSVIDFAVKRFL